MNMKRILISLALVTGVLTATAQSSDAVVRDKVTSAVMNVYDQHLAQNPNDYNVMFARAHQYFYNGDYTAALADVNQALLLTPKTDKELRFDEYILRARISDARHDYIGELADLRLAHELQPKSLPCTDLIAKANLKAGNLDAAAKAFKTILRAEPKNYDAMYGLAQVEQARGNAKGALEQVNKAVDLFHAEPQVYVNRSDIYARQGNINAAVQDLLQGMGVGDGGTAIKQLFDLSDKNYDGVMSALATIADQNAASSGVYRYLRANIAIDHCRYSEALSDLTDIKRRHLYDSPNVDYHIAKCDYELTRYDEAISHVDQAIAADPLQPEYFLLKSQAEYYAGEGGNFKAAMEALDRCSLLNPQYVPMLLNKAALLVNQSQEKLALGYLNAAVANEPGDAQVLLSRAMVLKNLGYEQLAARDLNTVALMGDDLYDLKGFALNLLGRDNEAFRWLSSITSSQVPGGENYYYAALFMSQRGDNYRALDYLRKAVAGGYGSLHRLQHDVLSPVNLKSLRVEPDFDLVVKELGFRL